jgi:AcrR family transcriptional regulator
VTATRTDTRTRILDTAWTLIRRRGPAQVTVADIAKGAGVSRQLVYVHFANRAGLLVGVARHHDASSGFVERVAATRKLPPVEGLEALLRLWFGYIPDILPFARALEAAATTGDEGGTAWHDRMADLWEAYRVAVDRVHRDGRLADRWTVRPATDLAAPGRRARLAPRRLHRAGRPLDPGGGPRPRLRRFLSRRSLPW